MVRNRVQIAIGGFVYIGKANFLMLCRVIFNRRLGGATTSSGAAAFFAGAPLPIAADDAAERASIDKAVNEAPANLYIRTSEA
jgi:hypothetical protein